MDIIEHYKGKVGNITLGEEQENERISVSKTLTNVDDQQTVQEEQFFYFVNKLKQNQSASKCVVCGHSCPKYTCPKCRMRYCSSSHYKSHNLFCSQRFYQQQVELLLKGTKVDKSQRQKTVEMLKRNRQEEIKDEDSLMQEVQVEEITEERLAELMKSLENNQKVTLSSNEEIIFERYLREVNREIEGKQTRGRAYREEKDILEENIKDFMAYQPPWEIPDGISQYFVQEDISIEQYNSSAHKQLIDYRRVAAQILRKETFRLQDIINPYKLSPLLNQQLLQILYLAALLIRFLSGDLSTQNDFIKIFMQLFQADFSKQIDKKQKQSVLNIFSLVKHHMASLANQDLVAMLTAWHYIAIEDCQKITQNKFYCLQLIMILIETFRNARTDVPKRKDDIMKPSKSQKRKLSVQQKAMNNAIVKMNKKLQLLLAFVNEVLYSRADQIQQSGYEGTIFNCDNLAVLKNQLELEKRQLDQCKSLQITREKMVKEHVQRKLNGILIPK